MELFIGLRLHSYLFSDSYTQIFLCLHSLRGTRWSGTISSFGNHTKCLAEDMSETWCLKICCKSHVEVNAEQHS